MQKILISACLLGQPVRYDGRGLTLSNKWLDQWQSEGRLVPFCPEIAAGFTTPREPAEIEAGQGGADVWAGRARIRDRKGADVTDAFVRGARLTRQLAKAERIRLALLTDGSPSCGSNEIYSGEHEGTRRAGAGVVTAALRDMGVRVFSQKELEKLSILINPSVAR